MFFFFLRLGQKRRVESQVDIDELPTDRRGMTKSTSENGDHTAAVEQAIEMEEADGSLDKQPDKKPDSTATATKQSEAGPLSSLPSAIDELGNVDNGNRAKSLEKRHEDIEEDNPGKASTGVSSSSQEASGDIAGENVAVKPSCDTDSGDQVAISKSHAITA